MNGAKTKLKKALKKSLKFMLSLNTESPNRVPEWYDLMISELATAKPDKFYEKVIVQLRALLKKEYGSNAANYLLA